MIDSEGYRPNVGIILCNAEGRLFWARRIGQYSWQFPQGGIRPDESPEQAMFRELAEEVGLRPEHVQVVGCTKGWLRYRLPKRLVRRGGKSPCIGQKQVWFLLRMLGGEDAVRLDLTDRPEFDHWQWVDYWYPLRAVVSFKRHVYWRALHELAPLLFVNGPARAPATPAVESSPGRVARKQAVVLPLRRLELGQHPVITRMVISARRTIVADDTLEVPVVAPPREEPPCPSTPRSHRLSRR